MKTIKVRPVLVENEKIITLQDFKEYKFVMIDNKIRHIEHNMVDETLPICEIILISSSPVEYYINGSQEININDLVYDEHDKILGNVSHIGSAFSFKGTLQFPGDNDLHNNRHCTYSCYKVIATQSQLSPDYIHQFIEEYNAGNIKDVEIEMEEDGDCEIGGREYINYLPKLTDGFVAIVNKNDREIDVDTDTSGEFIPYSEPILYTEEEVHNLIIKFRDTLIILDKYTYSDMENWFEQNKKK